MEYYKVRGWLLDKISKRHYICPYCDMMVCDNGYGGIDYLYCPFCGRKVNGVEGEI